MYKLVTVARPYAKAVFDFAIEQQDVEHWQLMLTFSAEVSRNKLMAEILSGFIAPKKLAQKFIAVCSEVLDTSGQNLIQVMAENRRLVVLPEVLEQFILLRAAQEATVEVDVISISALTKDQLAKIATTMEQRLSCKVKLNCKIDKSIVAGIVIRAGDMVIDGSVHSRLERLKYVLQS